MNFPGHHEVALRAGLGELGRLGAMLPDFATMLGVRLRAELLDSPVRAGVAVHHATDAVFHRHPDVIAGMRSITVTLRDLGLPRGAARSCGHVGYEMLFDSCVSADLTGALTHGKQPTVLAALGHHPGWLAMRDHISARVAHYDDPEWVAGRLFAILDRRPRLRFDAAHIPVVAGALAMAAPSIRSSAPATFDLVHVEVGAVGEDRRGLLDCAAGTRQAPLVDGQLVAARVDRLA